MTRTRLVASPFIAVGTAYALFIGGAPSGTGLAQLRLISIVIIASALAAWALAAWRDPRWRPRSVFLPAIAASILAMAIATATSHSPRVSAEYLAFAVLLGALYLLLVRLMAEPPFRARLLVVAAGSGAFLTLAFVGAVVVSWIQFWSLVGRPTVPPLRPNSESLFFTSPNLIAPMIVLLGAVLIGMTSGRSRPARVIEAASAFAIGAAAVMTGSRGSWLGVAVGLMSLGAAFFYAGGLRTLLAPLSSRVRGIGPLWVGIASVATIAIGLLVAPAILSRLDASGGNRIAFYRIDLQLFQEHPVTGDGPGMWVAQRILYTLPTDVDEYVPHSHNIVFQTLGELGLVGAVAGVLVTITLLWLLRDGLRDQDGLRRRWALVVAFTSGYFIGHQMLDFLVNVPAILLAFGIPIALLDATGEHRPRFLPSWSISVGSRSLRALIGTAVAAAIFFGVWVEVIALRHADAVALANAGEWAEARNLAISAVDADPDIPAYRLTAALAEAHAGDNEAAATDFRAIAEFGDLPEAWLDLADAYAHLGDPRANDALRNALRLGIQQSAVAVPVVALALELGDHQLSVDAAAGSLLNNPSLSGDPWWRADPSREAAFQEAYGRVLASGDRRAWQVAMYAGDLQMAAALAAYLPAGDKAVASLVVDAWGGSDAAYDQLIQKCNANPLDPTLGWCRFVSAHRSDPAVFQRFDAIAQLATIGGGPSDELRIVGSGEGDPSAGNTAILWGVQTYRRFTPWDMLSPSLVHLALR